MLRYYHINKDTGKVATLSTLFPEDSDYVAVLSQQVKDWLKGREDAFFYQEFTSIDPEQSFYWGEDGSLVLVFDEHAEILDYKTDRSREAQYYIDEYAAQLRLYRRAFAQRLAVPVTKLTIYSFAIEDEIDVPLA